jgi:hypothetical protein
VRDVYSVASARSTRGAVRFEATEGVSGMADNRPWYAPFWKTLRFSALFAADTIGALVSVSMIALTRWWIGRLGEIRLFDWIPLAYVLDVMEAAVLLLFVAHAIAAAIHEFRGKPW